uniref:SAM-dependent methyltransferase n=1 Tax=Pricia sp. TaxID=2268138 RepID=UPI0035947AFB
HRVVNTLGEMFLKNLPDDLIKFEYPIWLWKNGIESDWPSIGETVPYKLDITPVFEKKWRAVKMHRSQLGEIIHDDPNGFVLTDELLEPFNTDTEYFFVGRKDLQTLDHAYFDKLYSRQNDPWNFRNSEYELLKYQSSIRALGRRRFDSGLELGCSIGIHTGMLSEICENLTAVDINEIAVREAQKNCSKISNIIFKVMDVVKVFPDGKFDLVTFCEMGYYLSKKDLTELFLNLSNALLPDGNLLMVHWTPFVPDYPLSGDDVHDSFSNFAVMTGLFKEIARDRHEFYRLQVWRKV